MDRSRRDRTTYFYCPRGCSFEGVLPQKYKDCRRCQVCFLGKLCHNKGHYPRIDGAYVCGKCIVEEEDDNLSEGGESDECDDGSCNDESDNDESDHDDSDHDENIGKKKKKQRHFETITIRDSISSDSEEYNGSDSEDGGSGDSSAADEDDDNDSVDSSYYGDNAQAQADFMSHFTGVNEAEEHEISRKRKKRKNRSELYVWFIYVVFNTDHITHTQDSFTGSESEKEKRVQKDEECFSKTKG